MRKVVKPSEPSPVIVATTLANPGTGAQASIELAAPRLHKRNWYCTMTVTLNGEIIHRPKFGQVSAYLVLRDSMLAFDAMVEHVVRRLGGERDTLIDGMEASITLRLRKEEGTSGPKATP